MKTKILSVRQPYAGLLCLGLKPEEYRSWKTDFRGKLLIHSTAKADEELRFKDLDLDEQKDILQVVKDPAVFDQAMQLHSAIIGSVDIVDCEMLGEGDYAWVVENPVLFDHPIEGIKGKLGLWEYDLPKGWE